MNCITNVDVPHNSSLYGTLSRAAFYDAYHAQLHDPTLSPAAGTGQEWRLIPQERALSEIGSMVRKRA